MIGHSLEVQTLLYHIAGYFQGGVRKILYMVHHAIRYTIIDLPIENAPYQIGV